MNFFNILLITLSQLNFFFLYFSTFLTFFTWLATRVLIITQTLAFWRTTQFWNRLWWIVTLSRWLSLSTLFLLFKLLNFILSRFNRNNLRLILAALFWRTAILCFEPYFYAMVSLLSMLTVVLLGIRFPIKYWLINKN